MPVLVSSANISSSRRQSAAPTSTSSTRPPADIPSLRLAIQSLDVKVHTLLKQRDALALRLSSAVAAQSPIRLLPDELLAKCFEVGIHQNQSAQDLFPSESEDPLFTSRILLVCKHWNQLACATPTLWSTIVISNTDSIGKAYRRLIRSKAVPLDITITFNPRLNGSSAGEPVMRAMEMLRHTIYKWRTFRMRVPNRVHAHTALKLCTKDRAPLLEAISVQISNAMQDDHYSSPPKGLFRGFTPRLTSCCFTAFNYDWDEKLMSGLKVLKLGGYWNGCSPTGSQLRMILEACPLLEELSFRNMTDLDPDCDELAASNASRLPIITLPNLRALTFYYSGVIRTTLLLEGIAFPALQRLECAFLDNITPVFQVLKRQAMSVLTPMNLAVGLPLRSLRIESCFFNELKLVRLLKRMPTISQLELVDVEDISSNILVGLSTPPQAQHWILPQLEMLSLEGCNSTAVDWDTLSRLVESRIPSQTMNRQSRGRSYASISAAIQASGGYLGGDLGPPKRLRLLDLTRCNQFSREQLQWLRMYVHEVRCDGSKSVWSSA